MTSMSNITALQEVLNNMQAEREEVSATLQFLSSECTKLEGMIERHTAQHEKELTAVDVATSAVAIELPQQESTPSEEPDSEPEGGANTLSGFPLDIDLSSATNHVDRIRLGVGRLPTPEFRVRDAADWLVQMGASNPTNFDSLVSTLYGKFKSRDDFQRVAPGVMRFVGYGEVIPFAVAHG